MSKRNILKKIKEIQNLISCENNDYAKKIFLDMSILDTKEHLSLDKRLRHIIWDINEYLVLENEKYIKKDEILSIIEDYLIADNTE